MTASGAKRPFVRKQHPVTDKEEVESLSVWNQARGGSAWPLIVRSRAINTSVACAGFGAFVGAAFIPSEPNAAVASVTNVTSFRTRRAVASQNIALYRRFGGM